MGKEDEEEKLSEADRRALRGSRFAPLPSLPPPPSRSHSRLAHPGGPLATNKAAALAKFLERKLQEPGGLSSINPDLLEIAVKNAKETLKASTSGSSNSGRTIRHVDSFGDSNEDSSEDEENQKKEETKLKKPKVKKNKSKKASISGGISSSSEDEENQKKAEKTRLKKLKKKKRKKKIMHSTETAKPLKHKKKFKGRSGCM